MEKLVLIIKTSFIQYVDVVISGTKEFWVRKSLGYEVAVIKVRKIVGYEVTYTPYKYIYVG